MTLQVEGKLRLNDDRCGIAKLTLALISLAEKGPEGIVTVQDLKTQSEMLGLVECPEDSDNTETILNLIRREHGEELGSLREAIRRLSKTVTSLYTVDVYRESELHLPHLRRSAVVRSVEDLAVKLADVAFKQEFKLCERGVEFYYRRVYVGAAELVVDSMKVSDRIHVQLENDVVKVAIEFHTEDKLRLFAKHFLKAMLDPENLLRRAVNLLAELTNLQQVCKILNYDIVKLAELVEDLSYRCISRLASTETLKILERWLYMTDLSSCVTVIVLNRGRVVIGRDREQIERLLANHKPEELVDLLGSISRMIKTDEVCILWHKT